MEHGQKARTAGASEFVMGITSADMTSDVEKTLAHWFIAQGLSGQPRLEMVPLTGGQSNPTFRVTTDCGDFVLRKRPDGPLLPSAHAIDREYRVMRALMNAGVPVPQMLAWCNDKTILGTDFYVMEFLDGRVFSDQSLPGMDAAERRAIYLEMNRVMVALHGVDPDAVGLSDFGRRTGNYVARQVDRWSRQCRASTLPLPAGMQRLMDWLPLNVPATQDSVLVHGDYRLDNLVFHPTQPHIIGVLDWELSTLGDPVADFSYHCMSWRVRPDVWRGIGGLDLQTLGIPSESTYVQRYARASGREVHSHWSFYMAYNLFRMAAILHGVAQRAAAGTASADDAVSVGRKAAPLAELAWEIASGSNGEAYRD